MSLATTSWSSIRTIFAFGDSYTTIGIPTTPTCANPLGRVGTTWQTSSGGENYITYLTTQLNQSEILTFDYAQGGATVDNKIVAAYKTGIKSCTDQVDEFVKDVERKRFVHPGALATFYFGINDINMSIRDFERSGRNRYFYTKILEAYFRQVSRVYDAGVRNFVFMNVPPLEKTPRVIGYGGWSVEAFHSAANFYNFHLSAAVNEFARKHRIAAHLIDVHSLFNSGLGDPAFAHNFWHDTFHPTPPVHKTMAELVVMSFN